MQRRRLLALLSTALGGSITGCPAVGDEPAGSTTTMPPTSSPAETGTPTTLPTPTPDVLELPSVPAGDWPMVRCDYQNTGVASEARGPSTPVETAWSVRTEGRLASAPIVAGDTVYVGVAPSSSSQDERGRVLALDQATGEERWRTGVRGETPHVYATDEAIIMTANRYFYEGLQPSDGQSLWTMSLWGETTPEGHPDLDPTSRPLIANKHIYLPASNLDQRSSFLAVIDARSGAVKRRLPEANIDITDSPHAPPALTGDTAYMTTTGGGPHKYASDVHALDTRTGEQRWSQSLQGTALWPVVADETVYVASSGNPPGVVLPQRGSLQAFDRHTGTKRWQFRPEDEFAWRLLSPLPHGKSVYTFVLTADGGPSIRAFDQETGEERWQRDLPERPVLNDPNAMPVMGGDTLYVPTEKGAIHAFSLDGDHSWRYTVGDGTSDIDAFSIAGETLFVGTYDGTVYAIQ